MNCFSIRRWISELNYQHTKKAEEDYIEKWRGQDVVAAYKIKNLWDNCCKNESLDKAYRADAHFRLGRWMLVQSLCFARVPNQVRIDEQIKILNIARCYLRLASQMGYQEKDADDNIALDDNYNILKIRNVNKVIKHVDDKIKVLNEQNYKEVDGDDGAEVLSCIKFENYSWLYFNFLDDKDESKRLSNEIKNIRQAPGKRRYIHY